jgi:predicted nucleic acid-binding Zn ribbon protein
MLAAEALKCDLLCHNCHMEIEDELYRARQRPERCLPAAAAVEARCVVCLARLTGQRRRFCSSRCKWKRQRNAVYAYQKTRGLARKNQLLLARGGKCIRCGYARCTRALTFHHRDPASKAFPVDARNCAGRSREVLTAEAAKCDLLCANCHTEVEEEMHLAGMPLEGSPNRRLCRANRAARKRQQGP